MASERTKTKKELLVELREARSRCAELEAALTGCGSGNQDPTDQAEARIAQSKKAEQCLHQSHSLLEAIGGSLQAHLFVKDKEGRYTFANAAFLEAFGLTFGQVIGRPDEEIFPLEMAEMLRANDQRVMATASSETVEEKGVLPLDGRLHYLLSNKIPLRDDSGDVTGILGISMDITERKELEQLREDVERIMRHDLKTPLNGIIGLPQVLMLDDNLTRRQREDLELIKKTGQQMLDQIDMSLDLFKMERGTYSFTPMTIDLTLLLRKVKKDLDAQTRGKNVEFEILADGTPSSQSRPVKVLGDELLCYSMLANILKNAVEASPPGERVTVRVEELNGEATISACNKGAVPKAMRDKFFDKYTTAGKIKGTGLGTYSARLMARTQSGTIRLDSSKQDETTVVITLPSA